MARGLFISFEGGEGTGKSTQLARLAPRMAAHGREVVATREPGGTPGGEAIRALLVEGDPDRWSPTAETLLLYAARADHLGRVVGPALARGAVVLCDRFADSTRAYQGVAGGASATLIAALEEALVGGRWPDITLVFDLPAEIGLRRARARGRELRFEAKGAAFHGPLREAFLTIARVEPERCRVIDASGDVEAVAERVWAAVAPMLERS